MGIYYRKLMESAVEKAVEDAIQTPDDVGVDLDAIEDGIVGKDGIEAHRDEVEAAEEGLVGDPLEETAIIMYESEYNFNQLMKCIGIAELNEFAEGRDFVLEGTNLTAFFEKAREAFVKMFEHFTEVFANAVSKMSEKLNFDKALVTKHKNEIKAGFDKKDSWKFDKAYDMDKLNVEYAPAGSIVELWDKAISAASDAEDGLQIDKTPLSNVECVKRVSGLEVSDESKAAGEMVAKLKEQIFVNAAYDGSNTGLLDTVIDILSNSNDIKKIRASYNDIKNEYKKVFKFLKECQSHFKDHANAEHIKSACLAYTTAARYEKNLQHSYFAVCLKAHKARRSQARRMALAWQRLGANKKDEPAEEPKAIEAPKNENAFLSINII